MLDGKKGTFWFSLVGDERPAEGPYFSADRSAP